MTYNHDSDPDKNGSNAGRSELAPTPPTLNVLDPLSCEQHFLEYERQLLGYKNHVIGLYKLHRRVTDAIVARFPDSPHTIRVPKNGNSYVATHAYEPIPFDD